MPDTEAAGRDRDAAGRSEQDWCSGMGTGDAGWDGNSESRTVPVPWPHAPRRTELPQSQVWVGYPPGSFVVEALATMDARPPTRPLAQAGLRVPRLVSVGTAKLAKLRHVVASWLPSLELALGTIPEAACLRMGTFSTSVSTFPSLVGPEVLTRLSTAGRWQGLLGLSRFWAQHLSQCLSPWSSGTSFPGEKTKSQGDIACVPWQAGRAGTQEDPPQPVLTSPPPLPMQGQDVLGNQAALPSRPGPRTLPAEG